jgi:hypothetical protein
MKRENKMPHGHTNVSAETTAASFLQPRQVFRSETRWGRSVIEWPSLEAFLATAEVQSGVHSVPIGEFAGKPINYDFFLTARPGTALLCHFHGNAPREGSELPIFTGLGVTSSIATSMFVPSDPVLVLDASLSLAWHFGCEGVRLQAIMVRIVQKLQEILQAPRVVAWGGSGGGFAAIRVAKDVKNAIALAWNPQTNIAKYVPGPVSRYLRIAFPTVPTDGPIPSDGEQFPSLCIEEFRAGYQGSILYLQERTDWHVESHLDPFVARFCGKDLRDITKASNFYGFVTEQLYLHLGHWGDGHIPPSKEVLAKLLGLLSDVTIKVEDLVPLDCFPHELPENTASNGSQHTSVEQSRGTTGSDQFGSPAIEDEPLNLKEILAIQMDHITDYFHPLDVSVSCAGDVVILPLPTGEIIEISPIHGLQWDRKFDKETTSRLLTN